MGELEDLQRENRLLRRDNDDLSHRVADARQALEAVARGEADAVTIEASTTPLLLRDAQARLRESKELLQAIFDSSLDAMLLSNNLGQFLDANPAASNLFGLPRDQLLGRSLGEFAESGYEADTALHAFRDEGRMRARLRLRRVDGVQHILDLSAVADVAPGLNLWVLRDVTEGVKAQEQILASLSRLEDAQAIAHVGSWTSGIEFADELHWTPECCRIFGVPAGTTLTVASLFARVHPEDREALSRANTNAIERGIPIDIVHRILLPDGRQRWVRARASVKRNAEQPPTMVGTVQDVTERHIAVDALRTSEAEFRLLAEAMPQIVWITRADGKNEYFNQQWVDYTGLSLEQSLGDGWNKPFHPDDKQAAWDAWQNARASTGAYSIECRLRRADGSYRWWLIRGVPVRDALGNVLKWFGTCTDIDALKQGEATVRANEALLRIAGRAARLGGWSVAITTSKVTWSDEVCRIHEVPAGTLPTLEEAITFYAPEFRDTIREKFEACVKDGTSFDLELQIVTSKGRRVWVRALGDAERDSTGAVTVVRGAFQDIDDLRKLQDQLRQAQKMEAIGRLAGGVAHDFNNVLSVILSYSEMIVNELKTGDPMRDDVDEIRKAGARAASLTRQLLMFSRQQVVEPKVLDINEVLSGMDKMLERLLGEDVDMAVSLGTSLGHVKMDPSSLEQIIMNLVVNARDAMPTGGQLTVETKNVELNDDFVREHVGAIPGPYVMLAVTDTGVGMDRATQARIFEPFFTTKDKDKGTGLGLSTVYGVVQQSSGIISVYSEPGKGTSFKVYLPRVDGELDRSGAQGVLTNLRGTETILLVEDEEQVRLVASSILRKHGYRVLEACHPGEALLHCEKRSVEIHLLITDVVMPQMSGPELAKRLVEIRPQMRVLCMSGYTDDSIVRHGVLQAEIAYLQKPLTPQTLTRKVREVLDAAPLNRSWPADPPVKR